MWLYKLNLFLFWCEHKTTSEQWKRHYATPFILYIVCKGYNPVNVPLEGLVHFDNFLYMHVGWCNVLSLK